MAKKWGKVDYSELIELKERLEQFQKVDMDAFCEKVAKELAQRLLTLVKRKTQAGKKPQLEGPETKKVTSVNGKKKSFLTKEGAILQQYWSNYQGGTLRKGWKAQPNVTKRGTTYEIEVYNPVEYASYVEYGHRQQAGRFVPQIGKRLKVSWVEGKFWLTDSENEVQAIAPKYIEKELEKELRRIFNA